MLSVDTNVLFHASNSRSPFQEAASEFLNSHAQDAEFCVCELVLMELYILLRNPAVVERPLDSARAVGICRAYRENRHWRIIDYPGGLMSKIWRYAAEPGRGRRTIFDARLACTLRHHGVTEFATRDLTHFQDFGFTRVWDPILEAA
jgi:toxin-antitoxin system PIN domain toxin